MNDVHPGSQPALVHACRAGDSRSPHDAARDALRMLLARSARLLSRRSTALYRRLLAGELGWLSLTATLLIVPVLAPLVTLRADENQAVDIDSVVSLLEFVIDADETTARQCLGILTAQVQSRELRGDQLQALRASLGATIAAVQAQPAHPLHVDVLALAASWKDPVAIESAARLLMDAEQPGETRRRALEALAASGDERLLAAAGALLADDQSPRQLRAQVLAALGKLEQTDVARLVLDCHARLPADLQPKAIELLTQRAEWSKALLAAIGRGQLAPTVLHANQVAGLLAGGDDELARLVRETWGVVRTERAPQRELVLVEMRSLLRTSSGDPFRGRLIFNKICGQCHQIHGQGNEVGPDLTRNGRGSFEQLLSSVFDPSLVVGAAYQARTVVTVDGRVLTGLVVEDSDQRIVLKLQGGKTEVVARDDVDEVVESKLSLMPEGLEKQIPPDELADLFAFLCLDLPPESQDAALIPGAPTFRN